MLTQGVQLLLHLTKLCEVLHARCRLMLRLHAEAQLRCGQLRRLHVLLHVVVLVLLRLLSLQVVLVRWLHGSRGDRLLFHLVVRLL